LHNNIQPKLPTDNLVYYNKAIAVDKRNEIYSPTEAL